MVEDTMFEDSNGIPIRTGDVVRAPIKINQKIHGSWGEYVVKKAPGGYILSYLRSEKGQVLPVGYTGGYMHELLDGEDEHDMKTLVFTQVPIYVSQWTIVGAIGVEK